MMMVEEENKENEINKKMSVWEQHVQSPEVGNSTEWRAWFTKRRLVRLR